MHIIHMRETFFTLFSLFFAVRANFFASRRGWRVHIEHVEWLPDGRQSPANTSLCLTNKRKFYVGILHQTYKRWKWSKIILGWGRRVMVSEKLRK